MATNLRAFGRAVRLAQGQVPPAASEEQAGPVWIQVAREGEWNGYKRGKLLKFDQVVFDQLITNLRAHPAFEAGPDGRGCARVVPFDYEHASELEPTSGSIPVTGAPAPAWVLDLEARKGDDGTLELWALTDLSEQAREQIRSGGYQWTSVAVWFDATHPATGEKIGPTLTSVAFTNHPFIQGMAPMAASAALARADVWGAAESPEEVMVGLRSVFGLPPGASAESIREQLGRLQSAIPATPGSRLAEDVETMFRRIRELLGLPVLSTAAEVVASVGQALDSLPGSRPGDLGNTSDEGTTEMNSATMSAATVATMAVLLGASSADERALLAAAEKAKEQSNLFDQFEAALGTVDLKGLLALVDKVKRFDPIIAALADMGQKAPEDEEEAKQVAASLRAAHCELAELRKEGEAKDVDAALASLKIDGDAAARLRPMLLSERQACSGDPAKVETWRARFPEPDPQTELLTSHVTRAPATAAASTARASAPGAAAPHENMPGRNGVEKARAYLSAKRGEGFRVLPAQEQLRQAGVWLSQGCKAE
jgi:hypothetical protein